MDRSGRALIFACAISIAAPNTAQAAWRVYSDAAGTRLKSLRIYFPTRRDPRPLVKGVGTRLQITVPNCLFLCDPPKAKHPQPTYAPTCQMNHLSWITFG
jgi:hypothetical protein